MGEPSVIADVRKLSNLSDFSSLENINTTNKMKPLKRQYTAQIQSMNNFSLYNLAFMLIFTLSINPLFANPSLGEEAREKAKIFLDFITQEHDGRYYTEYKPRVDGGSWIFELKSPVVKMLRTDPVTEADRLNGIEWKANFLISAEASRQFLTKTSEWTQWGSGFRLLESRVVLYFKDNRWEIFNLDTKDHGNMKKEPVKLYFGEQDWVVEGERGIIFRKPSIEAIKETK